MKKSFTGIICLAAILAASVVLLPITAAKIAMRLSKPRDHSRKYSPDAERELSKGFITEQFQKQGRLG